MHNILSTQNHAVPLNMILDSIIFILVVINDADTGMMRQKQGSNIQFGPDIFFTTGATGSRLIFFC